MARFKYGGTVNQQTALIEWFPEGEILRARWGGKGRPHGAGCLSVEMRGAKKPYKDLKYTDSVLHPASGQTHKLGLMDVKGIVQASEYWPRREPPQREPFNVSIDEPAHLGRYVISIGVAVFICASFALSLVWVANITNPESRELAPPNLEWQPKSKSISQVLESSLHSVDGCGRWGEWVWRDEQQRSWRAFISRCTSDDEATKWARSITPSTPTGSLFGYVEAPLTTWGFRGGKLAASWAQGNLLVLVLQAITEDPDDSMEVPSAIATSLGRSVNNDLGRRQGILFAFPAVVLATHFMPRRVANLRKLAQASQSRAVPEPIAYSSYEDATQITPWSRLAQQCERSASIIGVVATSVMVVVVRRAFGLGLWAGVVLALLVWIALMMAMQRAMERLRFFAVLPFNPTQLPEIGSRGSVRLGFILNLGIRLGFVLLGVALIASVVDIALSPPLPNGVLLGYLQGSPSPVWIWRCLRYGTEVLFAIHPAWTAGVLGAWLIVLLCSWRLSERLQGFYADERFTVPDLPPMIYLRSFDEDALRVDAKDTALSWAGHLLGRRRQRFEEIMAHAAATLGPVDAVIDPRSKVLPVGAARIAPKAGWQVEVAQRAADALCVIVSATPNRVGEGLLWELNLLAESLSHSRFCFVIGPWPEAERQRRLHNFLVQANRNGLLKGLTIDMLPQTTHVIAGTSRGEARMFGGQESDAFAYCMSLQAALSTFGPIWLEECAPTAGMKSRQRQRADLLLDEPADISFISLKFLLWLYGSFPRIGRAVGFWD